MNLSQGDDGALESLSEGLDITPLVDRPANSFCSLLDLHAEIDDVFTQHQHALLHFEFARARELLQQYETSLLAHMTDEEEFMLPLYAERAPAEKGGDAKLFLNEHEKMRQYVKLFTETTERLAAEGQPEKLLLQLLDRESFYKRLCSHHDLREGNVLYPALDSVTTEIERSGLFARFAAPYTSYQA